MELTPDERKRIRQDSLLRAIELAEKPQYKAALADRVITLDELRFLGTFEQTRRAFYQDGIESIDRVILDAFAQAVDLPADEAEERYFALERKVTDHYHNLQWNFGNYTDKFTGSEQ